MQQLLETGEKASENREKIEAIWAEGDESCYHGAVRNYFDLLINKKKYVDIQYGGWHVCSK